jgi:TctA family transporter
MRIFDGDLSGFAGRPISASLLAALVVLAVVVPVTTAIRRRGAA